MDWVHSKEPRIPLPPALMDPFDLKMLSLDLNIGVDSIGLETDFIIEKEGKGGHQLVTNWSPSGHWVVTKWSPIQYHIGGSSFITILHGGVSLILQGGVSGTPLYYVTYGRPLTL